MQIFLRDVLSYNFEVLVAANGQEGINFTKQNNPDLIISDIMMPIMDGIEMCKAINNNRHTSHIPIILLTAKNTSKERILGLKSGAVEYLGKPFNVNELLLKVNNIISTKINALNKFKTDQHSVSKENDGIISRDDIFIKNLTKELNNQIYNPDFKLENLSKAMIMSYSVIYRKCCEITDKTPVEYFRKLRLNKAAILILKKNHNISEAAYMVGYKDSKYFSKCFKEEFGKTPAAIKNEAKKTDIDSIIEKYHF